MWLGISILIPQDVDFLITAAGAPQSVKAKLLALPNTPFEQRAQIFLYKAPSGKAIQIDMTPDWQVSVQKAPIIVCEVTDVFKSPYVPDAARPVNSISGALPYISPVDLLVFKINSCGLRPTGSKKTRDAADAVVLLTRLSHNGPLTLTTNQKNATTQGLKDVVQWSGRDEGWWKSKLGLN